MVLATSVLACRAIAFVPPVAAVNLSAADVPSGAVVLFAATVTVEVGAASAQAAFVKSSEYVSKFVRASSTNRPFGANVTGS